MTRTKRTMRLTLALAVGALATTVGTLGVSTPAAAYASSSSGMIAGRADAALAALARWEATARPADLEAYLDERDDTARLTASELQVSAPALVAAWAGVSTDKQLAVLTALTQLGVPYRSLASKEDVGFDCSGLMLWAYSKAGIELPRSSRDQINAADEVDAADAEAGDLVFYPGHISMYLGLDLMVHSPQSGQDVEVRHLFDRSLRYGDVFAALQPVRPVVGSVVGSVVDELGSRVNGTAAVS